MFPSLLEIATVLAASDILVDSERLDLGTAGDVTVTGIDCDSRFSRPNHAFVCKGKAFKEDYLRSAIEKGASAYVCDETLASALRKVGEERHIPMLVVSDIRKAMGSLSPVAWGHPDRNFPVIGITGTKGKSTTAYMLRAILDGEGDNRSTGILGSIDTYDGIESFESVNTTPEAPDLWRHLANVRDAGLPYMTMEVSSQGLKYERVTDLRFAVACFLNIGRDHISPIEHPDFGDYFQSKLRIFDQAEIAVVNVDFDRADEVLARARRCNRVVTTSARGDDGVEADVVASNVTSERGTVSFDVTSMRGTRRMRISMPGLFNVDNALVAIAVAEILGIDDKQIAYGLSHVHVPGRMELLMTDDDRMVGLVDYAHNKLSYQRFFSSVAKEFPGWNVIALLGAPGDKAQERRWELPQEASRWADLLVYSEEDPAHENPADICEEMVRNTPDGQWCESIPNRPEGIRHCVMTARRMLDEEGTRGVVVCLLAKGDETRQHEGDRFVPCETDGDIFMREMEKTSRAHGRVTC